MIIIIIKIVIIIIIVRIVIIVIIVIVTTIILIITIRAARRRAQGRQNHFWVRRAMYVVKELAKLDFGSSLALDVGLKSGIRNIRKN